MQALHTSPQLSRIFRSSATRILERSTDVRSSFLSAKEKNARYSSEGTSSCTWSSTPLCCQSREKIIQLIQRLQRDLLACRWQLREGLAGCMSLCDTAWLYKHNSHACKIQDLLDSSKITCNPKCTEAILEFSLLSLNIVNSIPSSSPHPLPN